VPRFHRWFGVALVVAFLLTGQYMETLVVHDMAAGPRLLYRSRHIYILMAALINLALGASIARRETRSPRVAQTIGSVLLALGSLLLLAAFFADPGQVDRVPFDVPFSRFGIYGVAAGTVLHALAAATSAARQSAPQNVRSTETERIS